MRLLERIGATIRVLLGIFIILVGLAVALLAHALTMLALFDISEPAGLIIISFGLLVIAANQYKTLNGVARILLGIGLIWSVLPLIGLSGRFIVTILPLIIFGLLGLLVIYSGLRLILRR